MIKSRPPTGSLNDFRKVPGIHPADVPLQHANLGVVGGEGTDGVGTLFDGREHAVARVLEALSGAAGACEEIESREHGGI